MVLYDIIMMRELLKVKQEMDTVMPLEFEKHPFFKYNEKNHTHLYIFEERKLHPFILYS